MRQGRRPRAAAHERLASWPRRGAGGSGAHRTLLAAAAGFFEAQAPGLLPADVYVKRVASRVLLQLRTSRGETDVSDRLAQDLLFFCAQAAAREHRRRRAWPRCAWRYGLRGQRAGLRQQRASAGSTRAADAGAQARRRRQGNSGRRWPAARRTAQGLDRAVQRWWRFAGEAVPRGASAGAGAGQRRRADGAPATGAGAELAMEVATACSTSRPRSRTWTRTTSSWPSAPRAWPSACIEACARRPARAARAWMEELYRRVSDRQTMGSVVQELRGTLSEPEKPIDQFFRNPADKAPGAARCRRSCADARRAVGARPGPGLAGRAAHARRRRRTHQHRGRATSAPAPPAPSTSWATTWARSAS